MQWKIQTTRLSPCFSKSMAAGKAPTHLGLVAISYHIRLQQAKAWISQGYRTIDDLLKYAKLSKHQRIGIEHLEDFNTRIPREEVKEHGEVVYSCLKDMDKYLKMEIMGSYRRGKADCGDASDSRILQRHVILIA
jgi:hypothetical protein